jgi:hypothetical protein
MSANRMLLNDNALLNILIKLSLILLIIIKMKYQPLKALVSPATIRSMYVYGGSLMSLEKRLFMTKVTNVTNKTRLLT